MTGAQIMQVAPPTEKPYWGTDVKDGLFYTYYLPPGSYRLATLHGSSLLRGEHQYNFPRQGGASAEFEAKFGKGQSLRKALLTRVKKS